MIEVRDLCKRYGQHVAVEGVSFHVAQGEILGFLGPNGAGKTTTMRIITGFLPPSSGTVLVEGWDVARHPLEVKRRIGYLCEAPPVYREMVVRSYLHFVARIKGVAASARSRLVEQAIERCGLQEVAHRVVGHLSKGYRQRVGLAQAILHEPPVLILDEPTVGLDPRQITEIRQLIRQLGAERTVILSTHILPEVTMTCSRVLIINQGRVVAEDSIENLTTGLERQETLRLTVARHDEALPARLRELAGVLAVQPEGAGVLRLRLEKRPGLREAVAAAVVESGAGLRELTPLAASLEEVFLQLVTDETAEAVA